MSSPSAARSSPWPSFQPLRALGRWVLAALLLAAGGPAWANADEVQRMAATGRITLGVRDHALPLSYAEAGGASTGYHMDVCLRIVAAIRQRFDLPGLKVVAVPITLATRFAMLNNRTIDIECGHNPVNGAAMRQALLTHVTLLGEVKIMTRKDARVASLADLNGRSIGVIVGSTAVPALRMATRNAQLKIQELTARDSAEAFALLQSGRVDAIAFNAHYQLAQRALAAEPDRYVQLEPPLRTDPLALMFNLEDEGLHALANEVLEGLMRSGEMARLYRKWFEQPIPGLPRALGVPLPPALEKIFAVPGLEFLNL